MSVFLQAIENCVAAAGFSVGEFAALVFSGVMDFAEGTTHMFVRSLNPEK